ncbi:peptide deformylase [Candidatus Daviesbacteria bacterium]|nr:peptide deformylase [Candidatus Daviesbacteria bacterium]
MRNPFLKPNDPVLSKIAKEIPRSEINSKTIQNIIQTMLNVAYGEQKDPTKPIMVGLAAPQIGISKRIILVDVKADGKGLPATQDELARRCGRGKVGDLHIYINPEITWTAKQKGEWYEGCYSMGRVCGIVSRPTSIKIHAYGTDGRLVNETHKGYIARIFQHEIDHLNGKVFVDHIRDPDKLHWVKKSEFPLYRDKQAWRNWPKKYPFRVWKKISGKS